MTDTRTTAFTGDRTILCADINDLADHGNPEREVIREGLFNAMQTACSMLGISWDGFHSEDRGDGLVSLVPSHVPVQFILTDFSELLAVALHKHNMEQPPNKRFRMRLAVHAGYVHCDDQGVSGRSFIEAMELLDAGTLKHGLNTSSAVLALVVAEPLFQQVIQASFPLDAADYERLCISSMERTVKGRVRLLAGSSQPIRSTVDRTNGSDTRHHEHDFDAFYLANFTFLRNVLNARAQNWTLAAEVADEAMLIAYRKWEALADHPNPLGFVVITARRILSKVHRREMKRNPSGPPLSLDTLLDLEVARPDDDPAADAVNRVALQQALRALPVDHRECFVLHYVLDKQVLTIAELLGIPEGTVKTRLRKARLTLRELLGNDFLEEGGR